MTTYRVCFRCGNIVSDSDLKERGYEYQCFQCDEDLFEFETIVMTDDDYRLINGEKL